MAYKINYSPEDSHRYPQVHKKKVIKWNKYYIVLLILAALLYFKQLGIPNFLIPGDAEVTKNAMQEMISDMKSGESLDDALTAFCLDIIHSAEQ